MPDPIRVRVKRQTFTVHMDGAGQVTGVRTATAAGQQSLDLAREMAKEVIARAEQVRQQQASARELIAHLKRVNTVDFHVPGLGEDAFTDHAENDALGTLEAEMLLEEGGCGRPRATGG